MLSTAFTEEQGRTPIRTQEGYLISSILSVPGRVYYIKIEHVLGYLLFIIRLAISDRDVMS